VRESCESVLHPKYEARGLLKLLKNPGESISSLRELIGTSPERAGVLREFERLVLRLPKNHARPKLSKPTGDPHRKPQKRKKASTSEPKCRLPEEAIVRARRALEAGIPLITIARRFHTSPPTLRRAGLKSMREIKPPARRHRASAN
jgi:hypothetical protein